MGWNAHWIAGLLGLALALNTLSAGAEGRAGETRRGLSPGAVQESSSTAPPSAEPRGERLADARSDEPLAVASAPPRAIYTRRFGGASGNFDFSELPGRLRDPELRPLWLAGLEAERREALLESAEYYERIVTRVPEQAYTYWRVARNYWRAGESLPARAKQDRLHYFGLAREWAGRGIGVDPDCAPCMLWKFVAMGRQATTRGLMSAVGDVREMQKLLRRGIELKPRHSDGVGNSTLGNLYYAGAVFYRVIPDWFWLRWFIGVRGDKERSLDYARRAVDAAAMRVDYRVELGAVLLCLGLEKNRPGALEEGLDVLRQAQQLDEYLSTDRIDIAQAGILIAEPQKACGYSRDGFIDTNAVLEKADLRH